MKDITARALETLGRVSLVAAEDTRTTGAMLRHFGIDTALAAVHEHNERAVLPRILETLAAGRTVALVSDAGTPAISDPGALLIAGVRAAGYPVCPIPGACAAVAAMSVSGFFPGRFLFHGFLPPRRAARRDEIERLAHLDCALVLYEAPHRVRETLEDLAFVLGGERQVLIARELTKLFEDIHACPLGAALEWIDRDPHRERGEFVLAVAADPAAGERDAGESAVSDRMLIELMRELPLRQAVAVVARATGARRNELYRRALALREDISDVDLPGRGSGGADEDAGDSGSDDAED